MTKFLAILKREYIQRVRSRMFILSTILLPAVMALFGIVPAVVLSIDAGGPMRVAVMDQTGKIYTRLEEALANDEQPAEPADQLRTGPRMPDRTFLLEQVASIGSDADAQRAQLDARLKDRQIDGYLILPPDFMQQGKAEFFNNNPGDVISGGVLRRALNRAVREQRLIEAKVDSDTRQALFQPVELKSVDLGAAGEEREGNSIFVLVFGVGFVMYLAILMYGQIILGAVIEEKETRIAEILFSSVKPFTLMMGKLVGVSLVALTQLAIWGTAFTAFALYGVNLLKERGMPLSVPGVPFIYYVYFVLFFLLGYFIYATIYALVGSMVTTPQEGGQLAMPIILILVVSFYLFLPVSRSPDSSFSFWVSMIPFSAPVAMTVRIVTQTPPFWQIALSLLIGFGTVIAIMWIAARIYRVGMLMYGKRASIPEALRWARQA
ncbi:MAG TPA: ABC transporter permease [Pyrinomonadaceae bacterium]|nr:ABC transporter permease [Pyrinomonadaceae bacterium]